jgi:urease accessory protein
LPRSGYSQADAAEAQPRRTSIAVRCIVEKNGIVKRGYDSCRAGMHGCLQVEEKMRCFKVVLLLALFAANAAALAHPGDHAGGLAHGFAHPFLGIDHLLAMLIVGMWAARLSGGGRWLLPALFVCFMALGAAFAEIALPFVEPMIISSVLVLGLATVLAKRLPLSVGSILVSVFAFYHGHAHFSEMPLTSTVGFLGGMLLATALLHLAGTVIFLRAARLRVARAA